MEQAREIGSTTVDLGGQYRPLVELGRGGMARIFLAQHLASSLGRLVVLKVLDPEHAKDPEMLAAFRREAELGARLNHPNIVQVFEVFDRPSGPVMVMEYLEGLSLSEVQKHSELPLGIQLYVIMQTLAGLHHLHEMRRADGELLHAVHRDVSPHNIIVLHEGVVKVLDFGIAKLRDDNADRTRTGVLKGKVRYMAPEQIVGEKSIDRRADVFAVGILLWEAFANRRMWGRLTNMEILKALVRDGVPDLREVVPDILPSCAELVRRATAARPEDRFATALEMLVALEQCVDELGVVLQQRQVAEFMASQFGELREGRQKAVNAALLKSSEQDSGVGPIGLFGPRSEDASLRRALGLPERPGEPSASGLISAHGESSKVVGSAAMPSRVPYVVAALAVALALLVGGWALGNRRAETSTPTTSAVQRQVHLALSATPASAEIFVDGERVPNPFRGMRDASARTVVVEVRAPGHATETRTISLDANVELDIVLAAAPTASTSAAGAGSAAPVAVPARTSSSPKGAPVKAAPSQAAVANRPASVPSASAAPSAKSPETKAKSCNPPYTLSADGVKTYKPECF